MTPCECGHSSEAHEHYRPGTDCSGIDPRVQVGDKACRCEAYRPISRRKVAA